MSDLPILYSFRRCPYAMRARWALLEAGLLVSWREVELKAKPSAMLLASAKGTVPVLVLADGTVLEQSLDLMRWALEQSDPRNLLRVGDRRAQEQIAALLTCNDGPFKHHLDRFKYADRYPGEQQEGHHHAGLTILSRWSDQVAQAGWLLDHQPSLADGALWPFVRQWRSADPDRFDAEPALKPLQDWLQRFVQDPAFERLMQRADPWSPGGLQPLFPADAIPVPVNQSLFHLALLEDWTAAQACGAYRISTRGLTLEEVGFIHCSWREQLASTYQRYYADAEAVLLLEIDPALVEAPLRADAIATGELFPHLYGPLPCSAVKRVQPVDQGADL